MSAPDLEALLPEAFAAPDRGRCSREPELARYAAQLMSSQERSSFEPHLAQCADCRADFAAMGEARRAWDEPRRARSWRPMLWFSPAVLALGAAAALVVLRPADRADPLTAKGTWALHVAVEREGQVFRAHDGVALREGDRLGFFYTADKPGFLTVLYADEKGEVVRLHPSNDGPPQLAEAGTNVRIPDGALISPGQGCEWVIALFSADPLAAQTAIKDGKRMVARRKGCELSPQAAEGVAVQVLGVKR